jgi:hypothetical protein
LVLVSVALVNWTFGAFESDGPDILKEVHAGLYKLIRDLGYLFVASESWVVQHSCVMA